ncbi:Predicted 5' DNA nuclease, flap endonuclease-1-like, helix-3-turn-helix (H3TH) domain [Paracoccus thiocyanatus]|uniref:Predicted 5' DNA nuclease, flap endonuclease-1-like, helix-3-turn-helix (H3TH) domain n=1 Tax=Paracoccus thiocyanatus TaxID=34006 RepID=A0A1N6RXY7_9RHOB|nr:hypothetical protein [Paracoccus thiocyanatus]SIQ33647.1 Predicted 5' DNA nuclease, flap endonuclease-1-like, helix-3-turn-helix (H3TH) domain [Paracoccus thiocyanatus]
MERAECNRNCWISAAIAGVAVLLFTAGIGDLHWLAGLFLGVLTFALFGALMVWLVCHERPELFQEDAAGLTGTDWQRAAVDRQPETLLVSGSLGPEPFTSGAQMPIVAGTMPSSEPAPASRTGADDLKRIRGIGPKLSDWLNAQGVTRYDQIAAWDPATVADFAQRLGRMGGRIEADDWVGQARLLAAGGETAHSRRIDQGEVV